MENATKRRAQVSAIQVSHTAVQSYHEPRPSSITDLWERDLCNFYNEVSTWRVSAEGCGIDLPDPPARSAQLSPQEQWDVARLYWDQLMAAWQQTAVENGVLSESEGKVCNKIL